VRAIAIAFLTLGSLWLIATAGGDASREVGCIKTYTGAPGDYELARANGDTRAVQPMLPLFDGDKITVKAGAPPIVLSVTSKSSGYEDVVVCDVLSHDDHHAGCKVAPTYIVKGAPPATRHEPSVAEFVVSLGSWLERETQREKRSPVELELRDSEISAPLIDEDNARILEGTRTFELAWRGCNPSTFSLSRRTKPGEAPEPVFTSASSLDAQKHSFVRKENLHLRRGEYEARISCDLNKEVVHVKAFYVEGTEEMPAPPDFSGDVWPPDLQRIAQAGWLAENGGARWRLEAFMEIADLPKDLVPAMTLRDALVDGQFPHLKQH
jgi:hypothetical protein